MVRRTSAPTEFRPPEYYAMRHVNEDPDLPIMRTETQGWDANRYDRPNPATLAEVLRRPWGYMALFNAGFLEDPKPEL